MIRMRTGLAVTALAALIFVLAPTMAQAEKISTTSCKAAADRTKTQGGKTYNCTSCEACTTTTCETGGTLACTNTTTTSCSCTEVATGPKPGAGGVTGPKPGVLDPGPRPQRLQRYQAPGQLLRKQ